MVLSVAPGAFVRHYDDRPGNDYGNPLDRPAVVACLNCDGPICERIACAVCGLVPTCPHCDGGGCLCR